MDKIVGDNFYRKFNSLTCLAIARDCEETKDLDRIKRNLKLIYAPNLLQEVDMMKNSGKRVTRINGNFFTDLNGAPLKEGSIIYQEVPDFARIRFNRKTGEVALFVVSKNNGRIFKKLRERVLPNENFEQ